MKFPIEPGSITYPELKAKLEKQFPDYSFTMRGKGVLIAKKSSSAGLNILIQRKRMIVNGSFPTMGGMILFALAMVLLGIIIPIIIYFIAFQPKMKALEQEVGGYLQSEYQQTI